MEYRGSKPEHAVVKEENVSIAMGDGTILQADVYRPDSSGEFPVLIERTPYGKSESSETKFGAGEFYASRGYVTVIQDVRGRFLSGGEFYPFRDDGNGIRKDGLDTVEWAAEQEWSNGRIGTIGGSYSGATQYRMHGASPPHLAAQFVRQSAADYSDEWVYRNGALELGFNLSWVTRHTASHARIWSDRESADRLEHLLEASVSSLSEAMNELPVLHQGAVNELAPWWNDWLQNPDSGPYWDQFNILPDFGKVNVPIHHLGGWFDGFLAGTLKNYSGIRKHARTESARSGQRLTIGPWVHAPDAADSTSAGDMDFGPDAAIGFFETRLEWFDYWLKDIRNDTMDSPPVKLFTMGSNRWSYFDEWPPSQFVAKPLFLRAEKAHACSSINDGSLSWDSPGPGEEEFDSYLYDPAIPIPTLGGSHLGATTEGIPNGPMDQRPNQNRVLTYTGPNLKTELEVTGQIRAVLYGSSSAPDTDWVVKLADVHPSGETMLVCDGILRARYRKSRSRPELLKGGIEKFEIDLWGTSHVFKRGHRLQVIVCSSDFPRWDRNMNTGTFNSKESLGRVAENRVFHDSRYPSRISLPLKENAQVWLST